MTGIDTVSSSPPVGVTACPACRGERARALFSLRDRWMEGPGVFEYVSCVDCGSAYLRNPPSDEDWDRYYPRRYIRRGLAPQRLRAWRRQRDLAPRVDLVRRQPGARRLLDVGCATGDFLQAMRDQSWTVAGIEPTGWAADEAAAKGIPVWPCRLAEASLPDGAFDVATMWDVIEHLPRPLEDLRRLARTLRPGGRLVITTPVSDGWEARAFGANWPGWDAPRHLVVYSTSSLDRTLVAAGFRTVGRTWLSESYLITAMHGALLARDRLPRPIADALWVAAHARALRLAAAPVFRRLDRRLGGCWLTVVAERASGPGGAPANGRIPGVATPGARGAR